MCELEDVYHTPCGHWGPQRFIHNTPCIRSRTTSTGHILPCHDKEINGMSNSQEFCSACKLASSVISSEADLEGEIEDPVFPPFSDVLFVREEVPRNGSVSSVSSVSSVGSVRSVSSGSSTSTSSTGSERPVIRLKRLSAGKIHWSDGGGKGKEKGLNWFWFGLGRSGWSGV